VVGSSAVGSLFEIVGFVDRCDDDLEAMLISLARDCEATAKVARVSSCVGPPLPLRVPLFLRLWVDVDRDAGSPPSGSSSSKTVDSSSLSKAGSRDGARERERAGMAGVDCLDDGRRDMGMDIDIR
jgi:hypothetical protein